MEGTADPLRRPAPAGGYEPFHPAYAREACRRLFDPLVEHYFRPRLLGAHRLPDRGPLVLAANHSGNAFPYDAMVLDALLWQRDGTRPEAKLRSVFERELTLAWWMRPFGLDNFWRRCGGVDMTFDNFDRLLARGDRVAYYPEGVPGIGKGFQNRYRLQPFHTSFVRLAARHGAPICPVYIVNAEWVLPFNFTLPPLDWLVEKMFRVPFLPLPGAPLGVLFPWAWYLALPARMIFVVGEPIDARELCRAEGIEDRGDAENDGMRRVAERVRRTMQRELDGLVQRYGRWPFQARSLRRALRAAWREGILWRILPTGWTTSFARFERDLQRPAARGRLHAWLRDWDLIGFYLPFGWPLLSLTRALRKPPCGYRGLSSDERREREGAFIWHLAERPLPPRDRR
jgi:1-acyl-sn-glycerol-3-phosphate acyltransferase